MVRILFGGDKERISIFEETACCFKVGGVLDILEESPPLH